jgi:hypothetical protein
MQDIPLLLNVPKVHFYEGGKRCPEDIVLPSCLRAILEFLGEKDFGCKHCLAQNPDCKIFCSYAFLVGVSGAGAYLSWKDGWHEDNSAVAFMSRDPITAERRAFEAIGYAYEVIEKEAGRDNEALFRQRILDSLQQGLPVLAYGVIGPPEPCIVSGYDEHDEALIGWNFFQNEPSLGGGLEFEPSGEFRKRGWFQDTLRLIVIQRRAERPALKDSYIRAFDWMLEVTRVPLVWPGADAPEGYRQRHNGLAAYSAWAAHLLRDEDFPAGDEEVLRQHFRVHDFTIGSLAEARWYGSQFLIEAANPDFNPPLSLAEDLYHAAALYAAEHDLMWKLWDLGGGIGNPDGYLKFMDPAVRRQMIPIILEARDKDAQAAEYIAMALEKRR